VLTVGSSSYGVSLLGAITASGAITNSYTSLVSSPATVLTGTWFTGGTGTTTKPHVLIEPTGTTSTAWSTSGTGFGVNAASGFAGNLLDLQKNGVSLCSIGSTNGRITTLGAVIPQLGCYALNAQCGFQYNTSGEVFGKFLGLTRSDGSAIESFISSYASGIAQIGTNATNAAGSLLLTNLTASGTILTRNGTSPTSIQITNTYTSSTSFGLLDIRANAAQTAYEIGSFLGSAGGAALPINIGHRDSAGTFTSALSVATNGDITMPNSPSGVRIGVSPATTSALNVGTAGINSTGKNLFSKGGNSTIANVNAALAFGANDAWIQLSASNDLVFAAFTGGEAIRVYQSGGVKITGAITASGQITQTPPASVTLATNGQFSIEMTSNTAGNLVYRGSDGTTRRAALVFV
jgi:hypothetical protein